MGEEKMIAGGYTLDLYCDRKNDRHKYDEFPHIYVDEFGSTCRRKAREDGWILKKDGAAICPKCSGKTPKK
jgi:hypothetical protein